MIVSFYTVHICKHLVLTVRVISTSLTLTISQSVSDPGWCLCPPQLPEMLHGDSEEHKRCHFGHFILQNMGMLTGFSIMLLIAIFEDRIVFDFGF